MSAADFTEKFVSFVSIFANLLVCAFASQLYQRTKRSGALLLAMAAGLGAMGSLLPWIRPIDSSWEYWYFLHFISVVDAGLWLVGSWLLLREFGDLYGKFVKPNAESKGGPAPSPDNADDPGEPPLVG